MTLKRRPFSTLFSLQRSKLLSLQVWKAALFRHYTAPQHTVFRQFRNGAIFFAFGLILIYLANSTLPPSTRQEFIVLAGLIFSGAGFVYAMLAYIRLVIGRILIFFTNK